MCLSQQHGGLWLISWQFSNLLGTVYCKGNLVFTPDGSSLLSPVGNRVSVFDLVQYAVKFSQRCATKLLMFCRNSSYTLPFSHRRNISHLAISPDGLVLLSVDEDGRAILTHLPRRLALYHFSFQASICALAFSPTSKYLAVGVGRSVELWHAPSIPNPVSDEGLDFAPFVRHRVLAGHHDIVQGLHWSSDSRFFLSSAKDLTARIWSWSSDEDFTPTTLGGHKEALLGAWFSHDQELARCPSVWWALL